MRVGMVVEGGCPYVRGTTGLWCDRLLRGLAQHEFDVYALGRSAGQEGAGWVRLPGNVRCVRTAPLWLPPQALPPLRHGRRARRRFAECYAELIAAVCAAAPAGAAAPRASGARGSAVPPGATRTVARADAAARGPAPWRGPAAAGRSGAASPVPGDGVPEWEADRFAAALYGLAAFARDEGAPAGLLRSDIASRTLERACRAPGALRAARTARVTDILTVVAGIERILRPLSLDWYGDRELGAVDLCHAASGGAAVLPGLLARHFAGVPLLLTEYGVALREQYLAEPAAPAPVRALGAAFHGCLAVEAYRQAACITPGNAHVRRWQERCGAQRAKLRTVHPGIDAAPFAEVGEGGDTGEPGTLVWVGRIEPGKDLVSLLHAFAEVRRAEPGARLRIVGVPAGEPCAVEYAAHCRALAAQLFPDEAEDRHSAGENPVSFEEPVGPGAAHLAQAYATGSVVVLPSAVEGFPVGLVQAMFAGRATVSTDVGAVVEVIGGTGLVVPPRNPRAFAEACVSLLRNPARCALLGAAARARALELFSADQNVHAFHGIYLDIIAQCPAPGRRIADGSARPRPFAVPAEARVPPDWPRRTPRGTASGTAPRHRPSWAREQPEAPGLKGPAAPAGAGAASSDAVLSGAVPSGAALSGAVASGAALPGAALPGAASSGVGSTGVGSTGVGTATEGVAAPAPGGGGTGSGRATAAQAQAARVGAKRTETPEEGTARAEAAHRRMPPSAEPAPPGRVRAQAAAARGAVR